MTARRFLIISIMVLVVAVRAGAESLATPAATQVVRDFVAMQSDSSGQLQAIPEPATYILLGIGTLICAQQFRRKKG
jgi:hypothetical protein